MVSEKYSLLKEDFESYRGPSNILDIELLEDILKNDKECFVGLDENIYYMFEHWICKRTDGGFLLVDDAFKFWGEKNPFHQVLDIPDEVCGVCDDLINRWNYILNNERIFYPSHDMCVADEKKYESSCIYERIYIGAKLQQSSIIDSIMAFCKNVEISEKNRYYKILNGCVISNDKRLVACIDKQEILYIPDEVKVIESYSINYKKYNAIVLPKQGVYIKSNGIFCCYELINIISEGILDLEDDSIKHCPKLADEYATDEITLGVSYIKLCKAKDYVTVPNGIEYICKHAFGGKGVQILFFPHTIKRVSVGICNSCDNLKGIVLEEGMDKDSIISIIDNYSKTCSGDPFFRNQPGEYSIYIPDDIYGEIVQEKGRMIEHSWTEGSNYDRSLKTGKTIIHIKNISEWTKNVLFEFRRELGSILNMKIQIAEKYSKWITKCKEIEEKSDLEFMLQKKWDYTRINLHDWILDSKICDGLSKLGKDNYSIDELQEKMEELLVLGYDCSVYIDGLRIYREMDKLEKIYDTMIEAEMDMLRKISRLCCEFIYELKNQRMLFEERIKDTSGSELKVISMNIKFMVLTAHLLKLKEKKIMDEQDFDMISNMFNEVMNYCYVGYPSTPDEFL